MSGASFFSDSDVSRIFIFLALFLVFFIRNLILDKFIVYLSIWFVAISVYTSIVFKSSFDLLSVFSQLSYVYIPYFSIKIIGGTFWNQLENILYKMVIIVLPVYILSLLFPSFFDSLYPIFTNITNKIFYVKSTQSRYWYSFFFTYSGSHSFRNSGFMWEPGAYALCLIILLCSNIYKNGLKVTAKNLVYSISLITTFSTAGYLAFSCIVLLYALNIRKVIFRLVAIVIVAIIALSVYQLNFIGDKINNFIDASNTQSVAVSQIVEGKREANRIYSMIISVERSLKNPLGYGYDMEAARRSIPKYSNILTVNGLGDILIKWGWAGLILFIFSVSKFIRYLGRDTNDLTMFILFLFSFLICCFSNPISVNSLIWSIVLLPYIIFSDDSQDEKKVLSNCNSGDVSIP
jgi:hypothetical protein